MVLHPSQLTLCEVNATLSITWQPRNETTTADDEHTSTHAVSQVLEWQFWFLRASCPGWCAFLVRLVQFPSISEAYVCRPCMCAGPILHLQPVQWNHLNLMQNGSHCLEIRTSSQSKKPSHFLKHTRTRTHVDTCRLSKNKTSLGCDSRCLHALFSVDQIPVAMNLALPASLAATVRWPNRSLGLAMMERWFQNSVPFGFR